MTPVRNKTYTFADLQKLDLDDSPSLNFTINGLMHPLQDSHITAKHICLNCPEFTNSLWKYIRTTSECIPVFEFVSTEQETLRLVDHEPYNDPYDFMKEGALWVTPKGSPRPQYY